MARVISFEVQAEAVVIDLACSNCDREAVTIRAVLPVAARVFLKSYLRERKELPRGTYIICSTCKEKPNGEDQMPVV